MDFSEILVAPILAGIVGLGVWFVQSRIGRIQKAQERLMDNRRKLYLELLEPILRVFAGIKEPKEQMKAQKQIVSFDYKHTAMEFNLIGSDKVVRSFNTLMQYIYKVDEEEKSLDPKHVMKLWGQLILEIRRNVGEPNTKLKAVDMLRAQIADIEEFLAE